MVKKVIPGYKKKFGGDLLSHTVSRAVPSALKSLTSVFEMGTGVTSLQSPPKKVFAIACYLIKEKVLSRNLKYNLLTSI